MEPLKNTQQKFAEIAKNFGNYAECAKAVEKLTDQALLADVAENAEIDTIRLKAVRKITNQTLLANIA